MFRGVLLFFVFSFSFSAAAYFQIDLNKGKRPGKAPAPWTLADWLAQKNKNRLADHWLALHSSSQLVDLDLSAAAQRYSLKTATASSEQNGWEYEADLFISIFSLAGEFTKTNDSYNSQAAAGAAGLRLLGASAQTTSLVARYGWHRLSHLTSGEHWDNRFAEGALQLYIVTIFGLTGEYRYYFPANSNQDQLLSGHRVKAGAFLEFGVIRLFADYFQEPLELNANGAINNEESTGVEGGLKFLF